MEVFLLGWAGKMCLYHLDSYIGLYRTRLPGNISERSVVQTSVVCKVVCKN